MVKTKQEKIEGIQAEIKQLENQRKELIQKQKEDARKARTKRLCSRGGYLESRLPETITLTNEQFKILFEKTLFTEYAREILNGLTAQNVEKSAETQLVKNDNNISAILIILLAVLGVGGVGYYFKILKPKQHNSDDDYDEDDTDKSNRYDDDDIGYDDHHDTDD